MLPDFPKLAEEINERHMTFLRKRRLAHLGPGLDKIREARIHEGRKTSITRATGKKDVTPMKELSVEFSIKASEIPSMNPADMLRKYDAVAKEMAEQQARHMFETIDAGVKSVGNVVDGKGQKFGVEMIFEALNKIFMDFNEDGTPNMPEFLLGGDLLPRAQEAFKQIENDAALSKRFGLLLEKKRGEWLAREASRELVG